RASPIVVNVAFWRACKKLQPISFAQLKDLLMGLRRSLGVFTHFEHGQKSLLWDIDFTDALHAALSLFLLFQQFALTRDIAAIALCQDVLAHRMHGLACDDLRPDRSLDGYLKHLARDQFSHLGGERTSTFVGEIAVNDGRECVHR